jgi:hypothetical protein
VIPVDTQQQPSDWGSDSSSNQQQQEPRSGEGSDSALQRMKNQERAKAEESPNGGSSHPNS